MEFFHHARIGGSPPVAGYPTPHNPMAMSAHSHRVDQFEEGNASGGHTGEVEACHPQPSRPVAYPGVPGGGRGLAGLSWSAAPRPLHRPSPAQSQTTDSKVTPNNAQPTTASAMLMPLMSITPNALGGNCFPHLQRGNPTASPVAGILRRQPDRRRGLCFAPNFEKLVHDLLVTG
jgi:hypothetical protein